MAPQQPSLEQTGSSGGNPDRNILTLPYANVRARPGWSIIQWLIVPISLFGLAVTSWWVLDNVGQSTGSMSCSHCGALKYTSRWRMFGSEFAASLQISEGAVSKAIQAAEGSTCTHSWQVSTSSFKSLAGMRACGTGGGHSRAIYVRVLEGYPGSGMLAERMAGDKTMYDQLCSLVRSHNPDQRGRAQVALLEYLDQVRESGDTATSTP